MYYILQSFLIAVILLNLFSNGHVLLQSLLDAEYRRHYHQHHHHHHHHHHPNSHHNMCAHHSANNTDGTTTTTTDSASAASSSDSDAMLGGAPEQRHHINTRTAASRSRSHSHSHIGLDELGAFSESSTTMGRADGRQLDSGCTLCTSSFSFDNCNRCEEVGCGSKCQTSADEISFKSFVEKSFATRR